MSWRVLVLLATCGGPPPRPHWPLEALDPAKIAESELSKDLPPEVVALIGSSRGRHSARPTAIAASRDCRWVATSEPTGVVRIWDANLRLLQSLPTRKGDAVSLVFSEDCETLFALFFSDEILVWKLEGIAWSPANSIQTPTGYGSSLSTDARLLLRNDHQGSDYGVAVCPVTSERIEQGRFLGGLTRYCDFTGSVCEGRYLVVGAIRNVPFQLCIWDRWRDSRSPRWQILDRRPLAAATTVDLFDDGHLLFVGRPDGSVDVCNLDDSEMKFTRFMEPRKSAVASLAHSEDGTTLFAGFNDGMIEAWDRRAGIKTSEVKAHVESVGRLCLSGDGRRLYSIGSDPQLKAWDLNKGTFSAAFPPEVHSVPIAAIAISPDGSRLATSVESNFADRPNDVLMWNLGAPAPEFAARLKGCRGLVPCVAWSSDSRLLAAGGYFEAMCWSAGTGEEYGRLKGKPYRGNTPFATAMSFLPGRSILCTSWNFVRLETHDMSGPTPALVSEAPTPTIDVRGLAAHPDGRRIVAGSARGSTNLIEPSANGSTTTRLPGASMRAISVSSDGRRFAGASGNSFRIWDESDLSQTVLMRGDPGCIYNDTAFLNGGRCLAVSTYDGTLALYHSDTGEWVWGRKLPAGITCISAAADERHLALGLTSGMVYILRFDWEKLGL